jgi:hypothetical protein
VQPQPPPPPLEVALSSGLANCARCGGDHPDRLEWRRFGRPVVIDERTWFSHWAPCPSTGEPILLQQQKTP